MVCSGGNIHERSVKQALAIPPTLRCYFENAFGQQAPVHTRPLLGAKASPSIVQNFPQEGDSLEVEYNGSLTSMVTSETCARGRSQGTASQNGR